MRSWTDVENNIVSVERVNEYADTAKEVSHPSTNTHIQYMMGFSASVPRH